MGGESRGGLSLKFTEPDSGSEIFQNSLKLATISKF